MWKCGNVSSLSSSSNPRKCGNVEICLQCLYLITLEVWKCGNVPPLSLSVNTGSVEMWRNVSSLSLSNNSGSVENWKSGNVSCLF